MDKFEEKEMMKKRSFAKNTSLINYIPKPIKKYWTMFKTNLLVFLK